MTTDVSDSGNRPSKSTSRAESRIKTRNPRARRCVGGDSQGARVVVIGPSRQRQVDIPALPLTFLELPTGGQIPLRRRGYHRQELQYNLHRQKMGMVFQHFNLFRI